MFPFPCYELRTFVRQQRPRHALRERSHADGDLAFLTLVPPEVDNVHRRERSARGLLTPPLTAAFQGNSPNNHAMPPQRRLVCGFTMVGSAIAAR